MSLFWQCGVSVVLVLVLVLVLWPGPHASHILFIDGNYASTSAIASSLYKFEVLFDVLSTARG